MQIVPKSVPRTIFGEFSFFWKFLVEAKLLLVMADLSLRIGSNNLCVLWKCDQYLTGKFIDLKQSRIGCKKFQMGHPEPFLTNFQFFRGLLVWAKLLLLMIDPSLRITWNGLSLFWKGNQCLRGKFLSLKRSSIACRKLQRVHSKLFVTNFQFFEEF